MLRNGAAESFVSFIPLFGGLVPCQLLHAACRQSSSTLRPRTSDTRQIRRRRSPAGRIMRAWPHGRLTLSARRSARQDRRRHPELEPTSPPGRHARSTGSMTPSARRTPQAVVESLATEPLLPSSQHAATARPLPARRLPRPAARPSRMSSARAAQQLIRLARRHAATVLSTGITLARVLPHSGPPNTGDKLRSSERCAGFVSFIPLFDGAAHPTAARLSVACCQPCIGALARTPARRLPVVRTR